MHQNIKVMIKSQLKKPFEVISTPVRRNFLYDCRDNNSRSGDVAVVRGDGVEIKLK